MTYNPYALRLQAVHSELRKTEDLLSSLRAGVDWYRSFPVVEKLAEVHELETQLAELQARGANAREQEVVEAAREQFLAKGAHVPISRILLAMVPILGAPLSPEQVAKRAAHAGSVAKLAEIRRSRAAADGTARLV